MADKIFRVNMTDMTTAVEEVPVDWLGLGGRGLTSAIVAAEVPATCHPLGKDNKLVFAPGLLSGTRAANSGRLSAGAKSPLTGTIKESNAGGTASQIMARMGIKALIIEGLPEKDAFYSLRVTTDGVAISEETALVGKGNFAVVESLGRDVGVLSIGQAGENRMAAANISVMDPDGKLRSLGRGGLGAVMGAKRIKYIVLDPAGAPKTVSLVDEEKFKAAAKVFAKALHDHPVCGDALPNYGTNILINIVNEVGGLPTKNFRSGQFDAHDLISGEKMRELIDARGGKPRHGCHPGCVIQCSQVFVDKDGNYVTSGFEYESIWAMGANCCIDDLDIMAEADHVMDDIGVDTIETAVTIGVAMEAGLLPFGDGPGFLRLLGEIEAATPMGRILGAGAAITGRTYGVTRVPVVKGQAIPAYDPRTVKGIGITYCTSTMGADHTAGYTVATNILKSGGFVDPLQKEGQVELSRNLQIATAAVDSTGLCVFVAFAVLDNEAALPAVVEMINARFGISLTIDDVMELGKTILKTERAFNQAAGFTKEDDRLPEFFAEPVQPHNATWDFTGEEIDAFWNF
ncbi:MAG: aldehyde ferredoxin oxidoreductase [Deltaproteobacteria bacterium]|nr:aldehyde ferredoxin oxidoreductase [Candidatus Anaeroferrophillus wilburensis]MBN2889413.1 aldehyde ferredoxin oxidoreductase [Deltaproteobacteria bacterium]